MDNELFNELVEQGHINRVREALCQGWDPNAISSKGLRPLHVAVIRMDVEMAALLMHGGADPRLADRWGRDALALSKLYQGPFHGS